MNKIFLCLIISLLALAGCGQKGPLYLPEDNHQTELSASPFTLATTADGSF